VTQPEHGGAAVTSVFLCLY